MPGIFALGLCLVAGWFLARALTAGMSAGPRWAGLAMEAALGALFGPGLASIFYFALVRAGVASAPTVFGTLTVFTGISAAVWWRFTPRDLVAEAPGQPNQKKYQWTWLLWIAVAAGLAFLILDVQSATAGNPLGQWDAMAVWNLRARFLASGGDLWRRALIGPPAPHPGYPLFLSGLIGLQWTAGGAFDDSTPLVTGLLMAAAGFLLLGSSMSSRRAVSLGLLAWLILLASEVFASQVAIQYADIFQGFAFLAVVVLLEAATRVSSPRLWIAAGLAAGLCCWIKNEGLFFAGGAFAVALWRGRGRGIPFFTLGAAPGVLATLFLKLFVAQGREGNLPQSVHSAFTNLLSIGRWGQSALGFGKAIFEAGALWSHPLLLGAILVLGLGLVAPPQRRPYLWLWIPVAVTVAAEFAQYLVTDVDLAWQIEGSANRLVAQLWPSLIWLFIVNLRAPEELLETPAPKRSKIPK